MVIYSLMPFSMVEIRGVMTIMSKKTIMVLIVVMVSPMVIK